VFVPGHAGDVVWMFDVGVVGESCAGETRLDEVLECSVNASRRLCWWEVPRVWRRVGYRGAGWLKLACDRAAVAACAVVDDGSERSALDRVEGERCDGEGGEYREEPVGETRRVVIGNGEYNESEDTTDPRRDFGEADDRRWLWGDAVESAEESAEASFDAFAVAWELC